MLSASRSAVSCCSRELRVLRLGSSRLCLKFAHTQQKFEARRLTHRLDSLLRTLEEGMPSGRTVPRGTSKAHDDRESRVNTPHVNDSGVPPRKSRRKIGNQTHQWRLVQHLAVPYHWEAPSHAEEASRRTMLSVASTPLMLKMEAFHPQTSCRQV